MDDRCERGEDLADLALGDLGGGERRAEVGKVGGVVASEREGGGGEVLGRGEEMRRAVLRIASWESARFEKFRATTTQ